MYIGELRSAWHCQRHDPEDYCNFVASIIFLGICHYMFEYKSCVPSLNCCKVFCTSLTRVIVKYKIYAYALVTCKKLNKDDDVTNLCLFVCSCYPYIIKYEYFRAYTNFGAFRHENTHIDFRDDEYNNVKIIPENALFGSTNHKIHAICQNLPP